MHEVGRSGPLRRGAPGRCALPRMHHNFPNLAHPLSALVERGKATLSRLAPTKSARQGASVTPLSVMDAGYQQRGLHIIGRVRCPQRTWLDQGRLRATVPTGLGGISDPDLHPRPAGTRALPPLPVVAVVGRAEQDDGVRVLEHQHRVTGDQGGATIDDGPADGFGPLLGDGALRIKFAEE